MSTVIRLKDVLRGTLPAKTISLPLNNTKLEKQIWLPFEGGDATLTLILSKAFLLADDENVKDASIVAQLKRRG